MLSAIGIDTIDELFADVPRELILNHTLDIPAGQSDFEVEKDISGTAGKNRLLEIFAGAGCYNHYIPAVVDSLSARSEFTTSYTPYQPEVSQGTLAAMFEFQTMICRLTGLDVSNSSLYDGATAVAESILLSARISHRTTICVSKNLNPLYLRVLRTYCWASGILLKEIELLDGSTRIETLEAFLDEDVSAVVVQNPGFFGCIEDIAAISSMARQRSIHTIVAVTEPLSLAMLRSPGECGADICCGEARSFGNPPGFGGPLLGFIAAKKDFMRQMPGRIVGRTVDSRGETAYVLTLQTREQHIRRERATSNICTNQGLCALRAAIYLGLHGSSIENLARINHDRALILRDALDAIGIRTIYKKSFFNEFTVSLENAERIRKALVSSGFLFGIELARYYPEMKNQVLVCATENNDSDSIERLVRALRDS